MSKKKSFLYFLVCFVLVLVILYIITRVRMAEATNASAELAAVTPKLSYMITCIVIDLISSLTVVCCMNKIYRKKNEEEDKNSNQQE